MLNRLGRWLRAAGYDTHIAAAGTSDREIVAAARRERRLLVTRDTRMLEHRHAPGGIVLLRENSVDACALELAHRLSLDWLYRPFSRCMDCNTPLERARAGHLQRIPADARRPGEVILHCPRCDRVYWPGSHVKRMHRRLTAWRETATAK